MALLEEVRLNAPSFFSSTALFLELKIQNTNTIRTLINSGASDNFMDSRFAHDFPLENLKKPLRHTLFDGSAASQGLLFQSVTLDVDLPCGTRHSVRFLLTPCDVRGRA